jgi:hypothetical protein
MVLFRGAVTPGLKTVEHGGEEHIPQELRP